MARILSVSVLFGLTLFTLACMGEDPSVREYGPDGFNPRELDTGLTGKTLTVVETPPLAWHDALKGEELYREAKRREGELPDTSTNGYMSAYADVLNAYGRLAFGWQDEVPVMPAAEIDFRNLWNRHVNPTDISLLGETVDMLAPRKEFEQYGRQYAYSVTTHWTMRGFDFDKPFGGYKVGDKKRIDFCPPIDPKTEMAAFTRADISLDGIRVRTLLPADDQVRVKWTKRLAEISEVFECKEEGVPHKDVMLALEMYQDLGNEEKVRQLQLVRAHEELERFMFGYERVIDGDSFTGAPDQTSYVTWDPMVFDEARGWYASAGLDSAQICAALEKEQVAATAEREKAYSGALIVYRYCGDEPNMARMQVLASSK